MAEYIDRESAIASISTDCHICKKYFADYETKRCPYCVVGELKRILRKMHTADVVPVRHGYWVLIDDDGIQDGERYWKCSLCGCGSDSYDTVYHTPYCPMCGAKMDGAEDV